MLEHALHYAQLAGDLTARLWSNPLATPIAVSQDRGFREGYFNGSLSGHRGRHEWKVGGEASFASLRESFGFQITAYRLNGVRIFDRDTPTERGNRIGAHDSDAADVQP